MLQNRLCQCAEIAPLGAWREIIVEELDAPTNLDIEEATATCRGLSESDRRVVAAAEADIRVQLHRAVRKH